MMEVGKSSLSLGVRAILQTALAFSKPLWDGCVNILHRLVEILPADTSMPRVLIAMALGLGQCANVAYDFYDRHTNASNNNCAVE